MAKKIKVDSDAGDADVMSVVQQTADQLGYLLEQHGPRSATAHEGGEPVTRTATATRARLDIELKPGVIEVKRETNGVAFLGATPFFMARINNRYSKFTKELKKTAATAGLA